MKKLQAGGFGFGAVIDPPGTDKRARLQRIGSGLNAASLQPCRIEAKVRALKLTLAPATTIPMTITGQETCE